MANTYNLFSLSKEYKLKTVMSLLLIIIFCANSCYNTRHIQINNDAIDSEHKLTAECFIIFVVLKDKKKIVFNDKGAKYDPSTETIIGEDTDNSIHIIEKNDIQYVAVEEIDKATSILAPMGSLILILAVVAVLHMSISNRQFAP